MRLLIFTVALVVAVHSLATPQQTDSLSGRQGNMIFLGSADGKNYFKDASGTMILTKISPYLKNWAAAHAVCNQSNMHLASITTQNQKIMLENSLDFEYNTAYWTSGRDAHEYRQFTWDDTGTQPDPLYSPLRENRLDGYKSCVYGVKYSSSGFSIDFYPCDQLAPGALCST